VLHDLCLSPSTIIGVISQAEKVGGGGGIWHELCSTYQEEKGYRVLVAKLCRKETTWET
jgi:hypothetical protein